MPTDMFLKMDPIKGEAKDQTYKDAIEVLSWSWGETQSGTMHQTTGGGAGKVSVSDLTFTKWVDKATTELWKSCATGKHFDKALLVVRKAGGDPLEYLKVEMTEVIVTGVHTGGSHGEDHLTENVTLNFAKFKMDYTQQTEKGAKGATPTFSYDIPGNKAGGA